MAPDPSLPTAAPASDPAKPPASRNTFVLVLIGAFLLVALALATCSGTAYD